MRFAAQAAAGTKVVTENTQAVEVTAQVIDLDARILNLQASETALQAISAQATRISDILEVQARLTETRGQIESLTAQRKELNDRSAFATMSVSFNAPVVAVEVAAKGWDPAEIVDSALATSVSVVQGLATAGIWFVIVWLPIIVVLILLGAIGLALIRRFSLGRRVASAVGGPPPATPMAGDGWRNRAHLPGHPGSLTPAWHDGSMTDQGDRYDRMATGYARWWAPVLAPAVAELLDDVDAP